MLDHETEFYQFSNILIKASSLVHTLIMMPMLRFYMKPYDQFFIKLPTVVHFMNKRRNETKQNWPILIESSQYPEALMINLKTDLRYSKTTQNQPQKFLIKFGFSFSKFFHFQEYWVCLKYTFEKILFIFDQTLSKIDSEI
ncbi:unnamed protein product [Paramecium sonneborni]|uniref:Uncharacterized protein n=1 Tax=Paramecium sonneborni TaxID=65129 RepID=A0A8S1PZW3_9CILI|nr:unnamed protein product [Paramecium sonneborni]